jgi:hypothetical protein
MREFLHSYFGNQTIESEQTTDFIRKLYSFATLTLFQSDASGLCKRCFDSNLTHLRHESVLAIDPLLKTSEYWIGGYEGISVPFMTLSTSPNTSIVVRLENSGPKGVLCG